MDWTICPDGAACPTGMKYVMVNRAAGRNCPTMCVQFSADGVVWGKQQATKNDNASKPLLVGQGHAKPGIVAVPGALISSQTLELCPPGVKMNHDLSCGTPGMDSSLYLFNKWYVCGYCCIYQARRHTRRGNRVMLLALGCA